MVRGYNFVKFEILCFAEIYAEFTRRKVRDWVLADRDGRVAFFYLSLETPPMFIGGIPSVERTTPHIRVVYSPQGTSNFTHRCGKGSGEPHYTGDIGVAFRQKRWLSSTINRAQCMVHSRPDVESPTGCCPGQQVCPLGSELLTLGVSQRLEPCCPLPDLGE